MAEELAFYDGKKLCEKKEEKNLDRLRFIGLYRFNSHKKAQKAQEIRYRKKDLTTKITKGTK